MHFPSIPSFEFHHDLGDVCPSHLFPQVTRIYELVSERKEKPTGLLRFILPAWCPFCEITRPVIWLKTFVYESTRPEIWQKKPVYEITRPEIWQKKPLYEITRPEIWQKKPVYEITRPEIWQKKPVYETWDLAEKNCLWDYKTWDLAEETSLWDYKTRDLAEETCLWDYETWDLAEETCLWDYETWDVAEKKLFMRLQHLRFGRRNRFMRLEIWQNKPVSVYEITKPEIWHERTSYLGTNIRRCTNTVVKTLTCTKNWEFNTFVSSCFAESWRNKTDAKGWAPRSWRSCLPCRNSHRCTTWSCLTSLTASTWSSTEHRGSLLTASHFDINWTP